MFDRFQRKINYLRISVTDLCNLRCVYCMPAEGVKLKSHSDILSFEEIEELTRAAVELGINKVRLTGGEPLVRKNFISLARRIGAIPGIEDFALTTNGILLPQYARELRGAGLQRVNISLDSMCPERFRAITRCGRLEDTLNGISAAIAAGFSKIKINCVVDKSPDEPDAQAVAEFAKSLGLEARFIREMDTAKGEFWRVFGGDGGHCENCNRLRVASDGRIFPCLFSNLSYNVWDLGPRQAILAAVAGKPISGHRSENQFYSIGG